MPDTGAKAYEAHIAAGLLALGIQNINRLNPEEIDRLYDYVLDSLHRAGVEIEFSEIKELDELPIQEALSTVIRVKSTIIAVLQGSCSQLASQLFELTFSIYLVSTTPQEFSTTGDHLKRLASQVGFKDREFSKILDSLKEDVEAGLPKYESAVEKLVRTADSGSFLDLFRITPGVFGVVIDLKLAIDRYTKWRRNPGT